MSITIKDEIETTLPTNMPALPGKAFDADAAIAINTAVQEAVNQSLVAVGESVERAFKYADERAMSSFKNAENLANTLLNSIKKDILNVSKPKILSVEVNGERRKLTKAASPYLGKLLVMAQLRKNILLVGPAGCGKTTVAEQVAEALGLPFGHISFTAGASESWLLGRQTPTGYVIARFIEIFRDGGVFLGDEIDSADANTLMIINSALANGVIENPINGEKVKRHENFIFIGAGNTFGLGADTTYTARNRLDAATLDRFTCCTVVMDYCQDIETQLCPNTEIREKLWGIRKKLKETKARQILSTRALANSYDLVQAGLSFSDVLQSLTASWPENVVKQVGLKDEGIPF